MKLILLKLIKFYQHTLSPDHGWLRYKYPYGYCRFYPTCSEYASLSIQKHGVVKGTVLSTKRIIKCNPFVSPQIDQP